MKFQVEIDTDSAAFHAQGGEGPDNDALRGELADILRRLRIKVTNELRPTGRTTEDRWVLWDSNGNRVGTAWFEEE